MPNRISVIGCRLPHGIILEHPGDHKKSITLKGKNSAVIIGADYAITEVDADIFDAWLAANKDFPAIKSGAIFVAKTASDAGAIAKEFKDRPTGFEPMRTDGNDERASGTKTVDNKD